MLEQQNLVSKEAWATLLVILSGILYGSLGYVGTQLCRAHFSVTDMLFWRFLIATVWMLLFSAVKKENLLQNLPRSQNLIFTFMLGSIFYSGSSIFYFLASEKTGTGLAMVLLFAFPVFIAIYTWFNQKKVNGFALAALASILVGLMLMHGKGAMVLSLSGILLALLAALSYALYVITGKKNSRIVSASVSTILICFGNSIIFLLLTLYSKSLTFPHSLHEWVFVCMLGIFATALPIQLMLEGLKVINSLKASILSVLEPVVTLLVGAALLHESMSSLQALGVGVILLGAVLIQFERS